MRVYIKVIDVIYNLDKINLDIIKLTKKFFLFFIWTDRFEFYTNICLRYDHLIKEYLKLNINVVIDFRNLNGH